MRLWKRFTIAGLSVGLVSGGAAGAAPRASDGSARPALQERTAPVATAVWSLPGRPAASDLGDFYYFGGQRIHLERSLVEFAVSFSDAHSGASAAVLQQVVPTARVGPEIRAGGRAFQTFTLPEPGPGDRAVAGSLDQLRSRVGGLASVYYYPQTGRRMIPTGEIVVKLGAGHTRAELAELARALSLTLLRPMPGTQDEFVLGLDRPSEADPLERSRLLYESGRFRFAEPDFIHEVQKLAVPNDPRFGQQWHLSNTGQSGGTAGADVKAPAAWDVQTGSAAITIAVLDDGVERTHGDLVGNIFTNAGEVPANGIDDDANGYVDDVNGWDFVYNDNDPSPFATIDDHGTAVAGVAAGRTNNDLGIAGACQGCKILPIQILSGPGTTTSVMASAIRYASRLADVLNSSLTLAGGPSSVVQSAIQDAGTLGRGGKGSIALFAAGNSASGYGLYSVSSIPAGTHRFRWTYSKDSSGASGDDTAWLGWVSFPGGELVDFEGVGLPPGWSTGGNAAWSVVTDPAHADEGACFQRSAKAGAITNSQTTYLEVVKTVTAGTLHTLRWVSSDFFDGLVLSIDLGNDTTVDFTGSRQSGVPAVQSAVSFPAAYPESIAVGASSNFDCRSDYSQFGPELDFVAPSSGGPLNLGIETTDRTGAPGFDPASYTLASGASGYGGTSSATALASGIAGLILSRNPSLTRTQVQQILQSTADKVGPEPYVSGRNARYGFGRLNAQQALLAVSPCATVIVSPPTLPLAIQGSAYGQSLSAAGGAPAHAFAVGSGSLPPGVTLSPAGVLSGTPTTPGNYEFAITATDGNACSGHRAYTVRVVPAGLPSLSVTDVAVTEGNAGATTATLTVGLSAASSNPVTVRYTTADGTATADTVIRGGAWAGVTTQGRTVSFEVNESGTVVPSIAFAWHTSDCPSGVTSSFILNLPINEDSFSHSSSFTGCFTPFFEGTFTSPTSATGWFFQPAYPPTFPPCPCRGEIDIEWVAGLSASAADDAPRFHTTGDYRPAGATLTFPAGVTSQAVTVTVRGDTTVEADETFFLNLLSATNATIGDGQGVGTIIDDDGPQGNAFHTLSPCRIVDTRDPDGLLGGPALQAGAQRAFALAGPKCGVPSSAVALSINVTVTGPTAPGNLRLFPSGVGAPLVSTINFSPGQTRANNAVVQLGAGGTGSMTVQNDAAGTVQFIIDVNGYFQ